MIELGLSTGEPPVVLVVGAHADDVELGCGGTLLRLAQQGCTVHYAVLSGSPQRAQEARAAARQLLGERLGTVHLADLADGRFPAQWAEVKDEVERLATRSSPDIVLAPRLDDAHQDHATLAAIVPTVFRDALVLGYEIPKLDGDRGRCSIYVPLEPAHVDRKWQVLDESYVSQRGRHWWDREVVAGLARLRGVECRSRYAEGFTCSKAVLGLPGSAPAQDA